MESGMSVVGVGGPADREARDSGGGAGKDVPLEISAPTRTGCLRMVC